jgi:hypothetical protein
MGVLAQAMTTAARTFLESLAAGQRAAAVGTLEPGEHTSWTYLPGPRPGVRVGDLTNEQCDLASALVSCSYGLLGAAKADRVVAVEAAALGLPSADPTGALLSRHLDQDYWLRLLGQPGPAAPWAWRLSGHHLVAQATVHDELISTTPQFFGANPTRVDSGPYAGVRVLPEEEDLARQLVGLLGDDQRSRAVVSDRAPADIQSRHDPIAVLPVGLTGLPQSGMDSEQQQVFEALLRQYLDRASLPVANRSWSDLSDSGWGTVRFSWAGGVRPGEGHYYAITAPSLLIEYDNTQAGADHIHSVWRDLRYDWGGDLLAQHYASQRH